MAAKLIEVGTSEEQTREILVHKEEFLIGRGSDCDLRLRASAISRHHCLVRLRGAEAWVSDLGSSNGTFLNGQRVRSQAALRSGDEIAVGPCRFVFDHSEYDKIVLEGQDRAVEETLRVKADPKVVGKKERGRSPGETSGQGESEEK
jgi:pSer/pThr/pTyr-binding forkhead associated (FHA) protein